MSRITRVTFAGLKGDRAREAELDRLNLFLGPVGGGKSSHLDAIRLSALGYVPELGKSEAATARIMSGHQLDVDVELDDGRGFGRTLTRSGRKLHRDAQASWCDAKATATETGNAIRGLFGRSDTEAAESLDLRQLLACSPSERAKRIEALLDASGFDEATLVRRGEALLRLRLAEVPAGRIPEDLEQAAETARGVETLIPDEVRPVLGEVSAELSVLLRQGVGHAVDEARRLKLHNAEQARRKVSTRAVLEDRLGEPPATPLEELRRRRDETADALAGARRDLERAAEAERLAEEAGKALPSLRSVKDEAEAALAAARGELERAAGLEEEAAAIKDPPEIVPSLTVEPDAKKLEEAVALEKQAEEHEQEAQRISGSLPIPVHTEAAEERYRSLQETLEAAKLAPWQRVAEISGEMLDVAAEGSKVTAWACELLQLAEEHGPDIEQLRQNVEAARQRLEETREAAREAKAALDKGVVERDGHLTQARELRAKAADVRTDALCTAQRENARNRAAYVEASGERSAVVDANARRRRKLEEEAKKLRQAAADAQFNYDRACSDLRAAEERLAGVRSLPTGADAARALVAANEEILSDLRAQVERAEAVEARRKEMQALIAEIDRATALQRAWGAAEWAAQRLREEDLARRGEGLESRMRMFLEAAGREERPFLRSGNRQCDFGWTRPDGHEVTVEALSGGETVLYTTALAAAVISLRTPELRVLLVEAAELGAGETALAVLRGCEAVAEWLGNICVATCAEIEPPEGWAVHRCGAPAERERATA